uniref:Large ribosomal subunit protein uL10 n=1 Tax=Ditylenchus dipsaci TaxID=166011 RepID=A0A915D154_9BILA
MIRGVHNQILIASNSILSAMVKEDKAAWKANYFGRITNLFDDFSCGRRQCWLKANAGDPTCYAWSRSNSDGQKHDDSQGYSWACSAEPSSGKAFATHRWNVGFVFTKEDLGDIRNKLLDNKRGAPAKAGAIAPVDVKLPPQNTGMGPEKTSFFQALQIPTKISRGTIEILNEVHLIKVGDKVGASESALLNMLNIQPFSYGLIVQQVYETGNIYSPEVLDMTAEGLRLRFLQGVRYIASVSLEIGYPTKASIPHVIVNSFKRLLAVAAETDVVFEEAVKLKEYLADPSKFVAAVTAPVSADVPVAAAENKKVQEEKEGSEDEDMGFGLFD